MAKMKLEDPRDVREKESMCVQWEYGVGIDAMIAELTSTKDAMIAKGAIPETISVEMETHYGYYDDRWHEWVITYTRKETQKEVEKRVEKTIKARKKAREARAKAKLEKEQAERKEFERLRQKFGDA